MPSKNSEDIFPDGNLLLRVERESVSYAEKIFDHNSIDKHIEEGFISLSTLEVAVVLMTWMTSALLVPLGRAVLFSLLTSPSPPVHLGMLASRAGPLRRGLVAGLAGLHPVRHRKHTLSIAKDILPLLLWQDGNGFGDVPDNLFLLRAHGAPPFFWWLPPSKTCDKILLQAPARAEYWERR